MRIQPMASALRVTLSASEARDLVALAADAERHGLYMAPRLRDTIATLAIGADSVAHAQAAKRADRDARKRREQARRAREMYFMIGDVSVSAELDDYVDISSLPDFRTWSSLAIREACGRPIPDQTEIRRNVWRVRLIRSRADADTEFLTDCTETADKGEARALAERLAAGWSL